MLRHPLSIKGKRLLSAQEKVTKNQKHLGKVHMGSVGRERRFLLVVPSIEPYALSPWAQIDFVSFVIRVQTLELIGKAVKGTSPNFLNDHLRRVTINTIVRFCKPFWSIRLHRVFFKIRWSNSLIHILSI